MSNEYYICPNCGEIHYKPMRSNFDHYCEYADAMADYENSKDLQSCESCW